MHVKSKKPAELAKLVESAKPAEPAEPERPAEPEKTEETVKTAETAETAKRKKTAEQERPEKLANPGGEQFAAAYSLLQTLKAQVESVIVGKAEAIDLALTAILARGHVLMEDLPGTGKTTLAKTIARSLGCLFQRVQFTSDLMPSDITGLNYYNPKCGDFEFRPWPVLTNILLADEINRAMPRTQSALLEAMEEKQVTVDGVTHPLPPPFFVLATQNPVESEGIFPLPFAQQDRFMLKIALGYPSKEDEAEIVFKHSFGEELQSLQPALTAAQVLALQELVRHVYLEETLLDYVLDFVEATRCHKMVELALSPRASLNMVRAAKALALLKGRDYVLPDDIKHLCLPVFSHRLKLKRTEYYEERNTDALLKKLLETTPLPLQAKDNVVTGAPSAPSSPAPATSRRAKDNEKN